MESLLLTSTNSGSMEGPSTLSPPHSGPREPASVIALPAEGEPLDDEPPPYPPAVAALIARVWGSWGEYTLDPRWRTWALQQLGLGNLPILVDLYAEPWNATAHMFITREMNAMTFSWAKLQEGVEGLLWANPPFKMLAEVADKIAHDPCYIALCTPEWVDRDWWSVLLGIPHVKQTLPPRRRIFFGGSRQAALPQRDWRTVIWVLDSRDKASQGGDSLKGLVELKEALSKVKRVDWSHGIMGGKPLCPPCLMVDSATSTSDDLRKVESTGRAVSFQLPSQFCFSLEESGDDSSPVAQTDHLQNPVELELDSSQSVQNLSMLPSHSVCSMLTLRSC